MTTYTFRAIDVTWLNDAEDPSIIRMSDIELVVADGFSFGYQISATPNDGSPFYFIDTDNPYSAAAPYTLRINGGTEPDALDVTDGIATLSWAGKTTTAIAIDYQIGPYDWRTVIFAMDGAPLPEIDSLSEWRGLEGSVTGTAVPTGALAPGQEIQFADLDYASVTENDVLDLGTIDPYDFEPGFVFAMGLGNDTVTGSSGDDSVQGNAGADRLFGLGGNDRLFGQVGNDRLIGGTGADLLDGGGGADILRGDGGGDLLRGGLGNDRLYGGIHADRLFGQAHADWLEGEAGNDLLRGGTGFDTLIGGDGADRLFGDGQNDRLFGGEGNDRLSGGAGNDRLFGQAGNDTLSGDAGNDLLNGGAGADRFVFSGNFGQDRIDGFQSFLRDERIDLSGVSSITGIFDLRTNHLSQVGEDAVIDAGGGNTITLTGIDIATLDANDFFF